MNNIREGVYQVVKYVATPLRFFAAVVVILAGIIVMLAWKSILPLGLLALILVRNTGGKNSAGTWMTMIVF